MRSIAKEKIIQQLMLLTNLTDKYALLDPSYPQKSLAWLVETEKTLEPLRLPIVSRLAALRGILLASDDGYQDPIIAASSRSKRKAKRALTAHIITQAEQALREEIEIIDHGFSELIDKLSQLLAIRFSQQELPSTPHVTMGYVDNIWRLLGENQETKSMFRYIEARIGETDRRYLLQSLLDNMQSHNDE
ncbi:hypothetical protein RS130_04685 [Paraglaciecola aquimarina]|uniref:Uncharacterized protein n=1 Tax=Paraglaciecola aquimarina TaxID=1235557 RepID=A0ABU3STJ5_9ALTE|nr:hypothetical protein [Paraglaciecola aquimarina]MDU0353319.1 hypothetical protein [Paraglaciecola aquimarina]